MMMLKKVFFQVITLALLSSIAITLIGPGIAQANPGWYNNDWQYRKKITINSVSVTDNLTNFPVLVSLASDGSLDAYAQDDGDDILFTAADEVTKLSHEIESFNGTNGQLVAWVKIPTLSAVIDTEIYMYYGNAVASNQEDAANAWDSNYKMVQHMEETSGGTDNITDSTINANHGTDYNTPTLGTAGQIDGSIDFDGSPTDNYLRVDHSSSLSITGNITLEAWVNTDNNTLSYQTILEKRPGITEYNYYVRLDGGYLRYSFISGVSHKALLDDTTQLSNNTWHYVVATYDNSNIRLYVDGTEVKNKAETAALEANTGDIHIGIETYGGFDKAFDGTIDETRISDAARSAEWIQTSYNNQNNPGAFITLGSETTPEAPVVVGGEIFPVDKPRVLAPWLVLLLMTSLVTIGGIFQFRKSTEKDRFY